MKVKVGASVRVIIGSSKNAVGSVIKVKGDSLYVSGINMKTKAKKGDPAKGVKSGLIQIEGPIHASNVVVV